MKKAAKENFERNLDNIILQNITKPKDVLENNENAYEVK